MVSSAHSAAAANTRAPEPGSGGRRDDPLGVGERTAPASRHRYCRRQSSPGLARTNGERRWRMGRKRLRPPTAVLLVPMSLTLLVGPWLPGASAAATDKCQAAPLMDDARASRILAEERPFVPTDRDLFHTFAHPDWAEAAPLRLAAGPAPTEEETREELRAFLERRFPCAPERVRDGLKVYNDPIVRQKIPDPTLRAALASLIGTIGEPAIPHLIGRTPVTGVYFGVYLSRGQGLPGRTAGAYIRPDGTREIVFDRRNRFAPFGEFSALLFHEILHTGVDDDAAGLPEEAVASALESLVYMQTILTDPSIAEQPDSLTRFNNNHMALVRL